MKIQKGNTTKAPTPGRQKGSLNKKTEHIFALCEKHNFDPIETLIFFATGDWQALGLDSQYTEKQGFQGAIVRELTISTLIMKDAAKDLIQFMYPKRKSVEHIDANGNPQKPIVLAFSKEDLKKSANGKDE
jgi:hypothetical protein